MLFRLLRPLFQQDLTNIDTQEETVAFYQQKTGSKVVVPLTSPLWVLLYRYARTRPPIGANEPILQYKRGPVSYMQLSAWFKTASAKVGLTLPTRQLFHVFRRTAATELMAQTGDIYLVAQLLGVTIETAEKYVIGGAAAKLEHVIKHAASTPW